MATYKESGVDIDLGDKCSRIAYQAAMNTFKGRKGMIGEPMADVGGFSGLLDMGDFYLVMNDDGVGTKIQVAEMIGKYDTMGYDLVAMVADDAVCMGAETISITNTLDVNKADPDKVAGLMGGLEKACLEHKIVVPGGEIAEMGDHLKGYTWNATAVGILEKHKIIDGKSVQSGDHLIALHSAGFRANGLSLVRHILKNKFGENWGHEKYDDTRTWGEVVLIPSIIYSSMILELHGRYGEEKKAEIKGIAHITGGGIHDNLGRVLKKTGVKADLNNLPKPHEQMLRLMEIGNVPEDEAYRTWNMGVGMIVISNDVDKVQATAEKHGIKSSVVGKII